MRLTHMKTNTEFGPTACFPTQSSSLSLTVLAGLWQILNRLLELKIDFHIVDGI